ncbi:MAG: symmetrical bis(5'-nucleosyl)-tetraphosphatase [Acidobacteriota bacterium]|nr:MAG: symmetrical bis(5'-nucleosyl)-tetraphosphatase [Acidobacteriota bacterium]
MATYAIGDVHGCWQTLSALLDRVGFDEKVDRLWFTGDLVNRGPGSLRVLRFVRDLGDRATVVLGNHDLHLLALAAGVRRRKRRDTLDELLSAPDREELLDWLRHRPLFHKEEAWAIVHAGLIPRWSFAVAERLAQDSSEALLSDEAPQLLAAYEAPSARGEHDRWPASDGLPGTTVAVLNALTRLRTCTSDGRMDLDNTAGPESARPGFAPWFSLSAALAEGRTIVFGHWASLGPVVSERLVALDAGCAWGGALAAVRLDDRELIRVPCRDELTTDD